MQLFRRIIVLVGRFETPSSDWGRPCPRIFLRRSLFVGSLNDSAAPGRKSRDNSKRTRILYSSVSFLKPPAFSIQSRMVEELHGVPAMVPSRCRKGIK